MIYVVITGKEKKPWPDCKFIDASKLSLKYSLMHKISVTIWCPTRNKNRVYEHVKKFLYRVGNDIEVNLGHHIWSIICEKGGFEKMRF